MGIYCFECGKSEVSVELKTEGESKWVCSECYEDSNGGEE